MNLDEIEARWPENRLANSDARADVHALIARVRELEAWQRAASNLLAIIHGDGGHYENANGTVKACKDAEGVVSNLRLKLDAATYALGEKP